MRLLLLKMSDTEDSDIENLANAALQTVVPAKSKLAYEAAYNSFQGWLQEKKSSTVTEKVMLAYFQYKSEHYKPNTMWCEYSKLRTMIHLQQRVDISTFLQINLISEKAEHQIQTEKVETI